MKTSDIDQIIAEALEQNKPRKHSRPKRSGKLSDEKKSQIRLLLNTLFMLGFIVAIALYFLYPNDRTAFFITGFGAMVIKIVEFILRFLF